MRRPNVTILGAMTLVLASSLGLAALRFATATTSGAVFLASVAILAFGILAAIYRRGARRAFWVGFSLFGWGYLMLASGAWWDRAADRPDLVTTRWLDRLFPAIHVGQLRESLPTLFAGPPREINSRDGAILEKLNEPISMPFPTETPLEFVIRYIKTATDSPELPGGIPIHISQQGLAEAGSAIDAPVALDLEGIPLRTSLGMLLDQVGLRYTVGNGLLMITARGREESDLNSFRRVGHSLIALLAACLGGVAGRFLHATGGETPRLGTD
jgi:hypothetical protein